LTAKKIALLLMISVLVGEVYSALISSAALESPSVLRVPQNYPTIQAAVYAATSGDTILVDEGTYHESVSVDRSVSLVGKGKAATIIEGNITVFEQTLVKVTGFTVRGGRRNGITVFDSTNVTIIDNIIVGYNVGIDLTSVNQSTIGANIIASNSLTGIATSDSYNNLIFGNSLSLNEVQNIGLVWSSNNTIIGNRMNMSLTGLILTGNSVYNTVVGNFVSNNTKGVYLEADSQGMSPNYNTFYHNSFINNTSQVVNKTSTVNVWDNGHPSAGNHWSDYTGVDNNGDGVGDTPYIIDVNNLDHYPLVAPYVDVSPPNTVDDYDGLWHVSNFNVTLSSIDDRIGVADTYYRINGGLTRSLNFDSQPFFTTESSEHELEYWSQDLVGNEELPHKIVTNIKLDKSNPSVSINEPKSGSQVVPPNVTITWQGADEVSGLDHFEVGLDGGLWINKGTALTHTFLGVSEGDHTVEVKAFDKSGRTQTSSVSFAVGVGGFGWIYLVIVVFVVVVSGIVIGVWYYYRKRSAAIPKRRSKARR